MTRPLTWVYQLLNLDAVSEHRRRVVLRRRKHNAGAVEQLDVLVKVHLLHTLSHARGVADLRFWLHKSDDANISIAPWAATAYKLQQLAMCFLNPKSCQRPSLF